MLKQRVMTAIIIAPITIMMVIFLPFSLFALFSIVLILFGAWEWSGMVFCDCRRLRIIYLFTMSIACAALYFFCMPILNMLHSIAALWWFLASILVLSYPNFNSMWNHFWIKAFLGWFVLIPTWSSLLWLHLQPQGQDLILFLLFFVWGADIGAYVLGRKYGNLKLIPQVSPSKTWVGVFGAVVTVLPISLFGYWYIFWPMGQPLWWLLVVAFFMLAASIFGDLLESMFKRDCGIKNSGFLFPGHGGVMDRIDSLTATAPIFVFCLNNLSG